MRLIGLVLVASFVFTATAAAQLEVNSYEGGTITGPNGWHAYYEPAPGRMSVVPSPTDPSHNVMRVELRDGDAAPDPWDQTIRQRAEAWDRKGPEDPLQYHAWPDPQGSERWYGWRTYLEPGFPSLPKEQWTVITQWQDHGIPGSPPYAVVIDRGNFEFHSRGSDVEPFRVPATPGMWHDFVFHVRWWPNATLGFIELFHNGAQVIPLTPHKTMDAKDLFTPPSPSYIRQGLYRDKTITATQVLYHDTFRVGTTQAQVEP